MRNRIVEQGGLTRPQFNVDGAAIVDIHDRLAAGQHVMLGTRVDMWHHRRQMAARKHAHAAARQCCRRQGDPDAHQFLGVETPVVVVLMPGDIAGTVGFLDEPMRCPAQDIRSD